MTILAPPSRGPSVCPPPTGDSWRQVARFFVPGVPRPGGSKTAKVIYRNGQAVMKNGRPLLSYRDDAKGNGEWKANVAFFARQRYEAEPIARGVPIWLTVVFHMPRPQGHFGSGKNAGRLKAAAPSWHTVKPDGTKLMRALEDALTGIVWADDAGIVAPLPLKVYGDKPGAEVAVYVAAEGQDRAAEPAGAASGRAE